MLQKTNPVTKLLLDAADYIEEHGWCQGDFETKDGVCAYEAMTRVSTVAGLDALLQLSAAVDKVQSALLFSGLQNKSIMFWNDTPGRTKEEVVSTLRRVAYEPD